MSRNKKWHRNVAKNFNAQKSKNNKNLNFAMAEFEEHFYEGVRICSYLTFQKLLEIKGLDYETYYQEIANLVVTINNEDDMELGVLRIAEKISNEMNLRMQYK